MIGLAQWLGIPDSWCGTPNMELHRTRFPARRAFADSLLRHGVAAFLAMLSILACTSSRTLNLAFVPELGEMLNAGPAHRLLMTSSADLRPVYDVRVGETTYQVCTSPDGHVVYIDTHDSRFRTPEGLGVGASLAKLRRVATGQPICERGWATWISLPSGWNAGFIGPLGCPDPLAEDTPVNFFFQRRV